MAPPTQAFGGDGTTAPAPEDEGQRMTAATGLHDRHEDYAIHSDDAEHQFKQQQQRLLLQTAAPETQATPEAPAWSASLCGVARALATQVTLEPAVWLFCVALAMASVATQNLSLEKACRVNLAFDELVCDALSVRDTANHTEEEAAVQQLTVRMFGWRAFFQAALPALLIPFAGSWSDRRGRRKPFLLLPIAGEIANAVGHLVCTVFYLELPVEADMVCESVFPSLSGGKSFLYMAAYTYIGDVTTEEQRTLRMGFVNLFTFSGVPIGVALSGILYDVIGFYGVFSLALLMHSCSFALCYFMVEEEPKPWIGDAGKTCQGPVAFVKDFFNVTNLRDTLSMAAKGDAHRRVRVLLLMLMVIIHMGSLAGEGTIQYLFMRLKFGWDGLTYSYFSTYGIAVNLVDSGEARKVTLSPTAQSSE